MKVSVILSTRNAAETLAKCLQSVAQQTLKPAEIIVVDRDSQDLTKDIAQQFTPSVYNRGPERSTQRNFGVSKAKGDYLLFLDADMELTKEVIAQADQVVKDRKDVKAISIPEESFGKGFWSEVKAFERSFYIGESDLEAPRFIEKKIFEEVGGYDENLIAGEDWDLANRIRAKGVKIGRINALIMHNEGELGLVKAAKKKFYYGSDIRKYLAKRNFTYSQVTPLRAAFFKNPQKLIRNPVKTAGLFFLKGTEFAAAFAGLVGSLFSRQKR